MLSSTALRTAGFNHWYTPIIYTNRNPMFIVLVKYLRRTIEIENKPLQRLIQPPSCWNTLYTEIKVFSFQLNVYWYILDNIGSFYLFHTGNMALQVRAIQIKYTIVHNYYLYQIPIHVYSYLHLSIENDSIAVTFGRLSWHLGRLFSNLTIVFAYLVGTGSLIQIETKCRYLPT